MKKLNNKKGFTIVELVIVIAVIGILAGVLIPTFSNIISKATDSGALQEATSAMKSTLSMSDNGRIADQTQFLKLAGKEVDSVTTYSVAYAYKFEGSKIKELKTNAETYSYSSDKPQFTVNNSNVEANSVIVKSVEKPEDKTRVIAQLKGIFNFTEEVSANNNFNYSGEGKYYKLKVGAKEIRVYVNSDYNSDMVCLTYSN